MLYFLMIVGVFDARMRSAKQARVFYPRPIKLGPRSNHEQIGSTTHR
jgi:hypothetical protein